MISTLVYCIVVIRKNQIAQSHGDHLPCLNSSSPPYSKLLSALLKVVVIPRFVGSHRHLPHVVSCHHAALDSLEILSKNKMNQHHVKSSSRLPHWKFRTCHQSSSRRTRLPGNSVGELNESASCEVVVTAASPEILSEN